MVETREDSPVQALFDSKDLVLDKAESGGFPKHLLLVLVVIAVGLIPTAMTYVWYPLGTLLNILILPWIVGFLSAAYVDITEEPDVELEEIVD